MKTCKVLIVDDEITILEGLRRLFDWEKYGCEIIGEAMDGISAIYKADSLKPDLVIMDINIPMVNGIEAVRNIKSRHEDMMFIIVTGYDDFKYCQEALRLSVEDYVLKPIDFDEFGDIIRRILVKREESAKKPNPEGAEGKIISRILSWMNDHMEEDISLTRLSEEFHLNGSYISQMFKNKVGVNYHTYLTQIRINRAKYYLRNTDMPISEIAELSGFRDYRVFTKVFKMVTGEQPSRYRRT